MTERIDLLAQLLSFTKELRRIEDAAAAEHGVTMWQYAVLAVLDTHPGMNQAEVAQVLEYSRNRIVADIDLLEQRGWLVRERGSDRRSNVLRSTPDGARLMRAVRTEIHRGEDELLADFSTSQRAELDRVAGRISRLMRQRRGARAAG